MGLLEESLQELVRESLTSARSPAAQPFPLPREHVAARIRAGIPLLHDQPAYVDADFATDVFMRLLDRLRLGDATHPGEVADLVRAADGGRLDPQRLFGEAFVQHTEHLAEIARQAGVDSDLLASLAALAVAPLLRAYAERLLPWIERLDDGSPEGAVWNRGYCPICGGWPVMAELQGVAGAQFLRCRACGSGWRFHRPGCPYCGNDDCRSIHSLTVEGQNRFDISVCERCKGYLKGYLKVTSALDPTPVELLAQEDVASRHLDAAALAGGYQRPVGAGYVIELAVPEDEWAEELA